VRDIGTSLLKVLAEFSTRLTLLFRAVKGVCKVCPGESVAMLVEAYRVPPNLAKI
jgi:hypothetical protein